MSKPNNVREFELGGKKLAFVCDADGNILNRADRRFMKDALRTGDAVEVKPEKKAKKKEVSESVE